MKHYLRYVYVIVFISTLLVELLSPFSSITANADSNSLSLSSSDFKGSGTSQNDPATLVSSSGISFSWKNEEEIIGTFPGGQTYDFYMGDTGQPMILPNESSFTPTDSTLVQYTSSENTCSASSGGGNSLVWANPFNPGSSFEVSLDYVPQNSSGNPIPSDACTQTPKYALITEISGSSGSSSITNADPNSSDSNIFYNLSGTTISRVDNGTLASSGVPFLGNGGQYTFTEDSTDPTLFIRAGNQENNFTNSGAPNACSDTIVLKAGDVGNDNATLWELTSQKDAGTSALTTADQQAVGIEGSGLTCYITAVNSGSNSSCNAGDLYTGQTANDDTACQLKPNADGSYTIHVGGVTSTSGTPTAIKTVGNTSALANGSALSCDTSFSNPITWIICPIIDASRGIIQSLDTVITNLLDVNGCDFFNTAAGTSGADPLCNNTQDAVLTSGSAGSFSQGFYLAWQTLRSIALAVVVITGLIMVIAQAGGSELFSAYTVKKVLPRMLIAVIAISLSWQLIQAAIQVSDDLGFGVRYLIYAPFTHLGLIQLSQTGSTAIAIVGAASLATVGLFGLLLFVLSAAVAVIIAFVLITFREIVLIAFAIFAPLAIALYILPGTEKVWKFWWSNMLKALIMFPLISGMIAIGRVFAVIVSNQPGAGVVQSVTAIVAYFGPYFLIPTTFKMAGGIMGSIGGFAQKANSAAQQPLANKRKSLRKERAERAAGGNLFRGNNKLARFSSNVAQGVMMAPSAGLNPRRMRSKLQSARAQEHYDEAEKMLSEDKAMAAIAQDDDMVKAAQKYARGDAAGARADLAKTGRFSSKAELDDAMANIETVGRSHSNKALDIASTMALAATGSGYGSGSGEMLSEINKTAGEDRLLAGRMLGRMRGMATQARRPDLSGAGFKDTVTEMEALHHAGNDAAAQAAATRSLDSKALKAQGGGQIVSARKNSVARLAPIMLDDLDKVRHTGDVTKYKRELASIAGRYDAMAQVSPENAEIMAKEVLDKKLYEEAVTVTDKAGNVVPVMEADPNNLNVQRQKMRDVSVREAIERNRGDEDFLGMRREYQSSGLAASQASNQAALMQTMQGTPGAPPIVPIPGQQ